MSIGIKELGVNAGAASPSAVYDIKRSQTRESSTHQQASRSMALAKYIVGVMVFLALVNMAVGFLLPLPAPFLVPYPRTFQVITDKSPIFLPRASEADYVPVKTYHILQ